LSNCSLFKSLTADLQGQSALAEEDEVVVHSRIQEIFFNGGEKRSQRPISPTCKAFYEKHIACSDSDRFDIFKNTLGQANSKDWFIARKFRVSASKARSIAFAKKEETLFKYFFDSAPESDNLRYGRETEPRAKEEYCSTQQKTVEDSGLVICRHYPWLCATPDGLVVGENDDLTVLEIKCPVSGQSSELKVAYLKDGQLKKGHVYYAQVQIQLFACDAAVAHFYMYGQNDSKLMTIERDDEFC
jgi:putative phage-type endonuclease